MEKEATTPDYYPLTLNSLVSACNQKSSRDPVVDYSEAEVLEALDGLQARGLSHRITSSDGGRVARYRHVADGALKLAREHAAAICILLLRGPQTVGEIRQRAQAADRKALRSMHPTAGKNTSKQPHCNEETPSRVLPDASTI